MMLVIKAIKTDLFQVIVIWLLVITMVVTLSIQFENYIDARTKEATLVAN